MNLDVKYLPDLSDSQRPRLGKYVIMKEASKIIWLDGSTPKTCYDVSMRLMQMY